MNCPICDNKTTLTHKLILQYQMCTTNCKHCGGLLLLRNGKLLDMELEMSKEYEATRR